MTEEIFGPVLPISTFKTLDEAIEKANDCVFGLTSSIYTQNTDVMLRALNEIHFGETYVNREHFEAFQGFHAGVRQSGIGGDDGERGLDEFLETHVCYVDYDMVTVDNAYGRTAQLQAYDYDTKEYVTKSTYQLDNAQTSTVQLTYDNSWKPYYYCAWIFCL
jgi:NAD-dependent aldehyde dehydrogenases